MNRRRNAVISLLVILAFGVSIVSVQALPVCEKLVKSFVEKRVPNRVSKRTLQRWADWGKSHPNFKPTKSRPKYKLTRKEVVNKVEIACEAPPEPKGPIGEDIPKPKVDIAVSKPEPVPYLLPELPDVVEIATAGEPPLTFIPPYTAGVTPPIVAAVPEPSGFILAATGASLVMMLVMFSRYRRQNGIEI